MSKYCINCGTEIDESVKFCPSCGTAQDAPIKAANYAGDKNNINVEVRQKMPAWGVVLIVIAALILVPLVSCITCAGCAGCAAVLSDDSTQTVEDKPESNIRDCMITPVEYEAMKDFEGNPVLCITYDSSTTAEMNCRLNLLPIPYIRTVYSLKSRCFLRMATNTIQKTHG